MSLEFMVVTIVFVAVMLMTLMIMLMVAMIRLLVHVAMFAAGLVMLMMAMMMLMHLMMSRMFPLADVFFAIHGHKVHMTNRTIPGLFIDFFSLTFHGAIIRTCILHVCGSSHLIHLFLLILLILLNLLNQRYKAFNDSSLHYSWNDLHYFQFLYQMIFSTEAVVMVSSTRRLNQRTYTFPKW